MCIKPAFHKIEFKMNDVFVENRVYKCIYYVSLMFGTWMTIIPQTHKVIKTKFNL